MPGSLMLVLPVPVFRCDGRLWFDTQACNGLRLWLAHFDHVTLITPEGPVDIPPEGTSDLLATVPSPALDVRPLPMAYTPLAFARAVRPAARLLTEVMTRSTYLHFAIGGFWGDWGALAGLIAARKGRRWAVWTDRVESKVMAASARRRSGLRRIYGHGLATGAALLERAAIRRANLGLFHGMDTFREYAPLNAHAELVHDVHLGPEYRIALDMLAAKIARARSGAPLRILYGGRAHPDKGLIDWIEAISHVRDRGVRFEAVWWGDGPDLEAGRALVRARDLEATVSLPGATQDRPRLMAAFRDADMFAFCHKTAESPRCLVEALLGGTPIIGYDRAYPRDLIAVHGGGRLTPANPLALAEAVVALDRDRALLADLIGRAAQDGRPLVDEEVFRHRAELMYRIPNDPGS